MDTGRAQPPICCVAFLELSFPMCKIMSQQTFYEKGQIVNIRGFRSQSYSLHFCLFFVFAQPLKNRKPYKNGTRPERLPRVYQKKAEAPLLPAS